MSRGERLRALDALWWVQGGLWRLAALSAGLPPQRPTRLAEAHWPPELLARAQRVSAGLGDLEGAYREAVAWTLTLAEELACPVHPTLAAELRARAGALAGAARGPEDRGPEDKDRTLGLQDA